MGMPEPDSYSDFLLDPDPYKMYTNPQHCTKFERNKSDPYAKTPEKWDPQHWGSTTLYRYVRKYANM